MNEKHYKEKLSSFVNHELAQDEQQAVGEHLLLCADCRAEHDQIKLGAALASQLKQTDAPENLWNRIENALDDKEKAQATFLPNFPFFSLRGLTATAGLLIVFGLFAAFYLGSLQNGSQEIVKNETPVQNTNVEIPEIVSTSNENSVNQNSDTEIVENNNSNIQIPNTNVEISPNVSPIQPKETITAQKTLASWNVETLAGTPKVGDSFENGKISVGQFLETDANSRAKIEVANIGNVEIAPNSRVQLVNSSSNEHRLSLERGILQAEILAPPRLFIVDTPSAVAVDLGCAYTLEVDVQGNSKLHVTSGFVALEKGGRESVVPAGAIALTKKGKGIGTPFAEDSSTEFQNAVYKFDFENGGSESLQTIIQKANLYDSLTLWHLLSRVPKTERSKVFDALFVRVKPPVNVTREGVLRLDKKMLDAWWAEIENVWFT
jgi:hypothetical protein